MDYCIDLKRVMLFSSGEISYLYDTLNQLITYGQLCEIHMEDNKIKSIEGVEVNPELKIIYIYFEPPREDVIFPIPDLVSHYCKRHLLRYAKFNAEAKKNELEMRQ